MGAERRDPERVRLVRITNVPNLAEAKARLAALVKEAERYGVRGQYTVAESGDSLVVWFEDPVLYEAFLELARRHDIRFEGQR